MPLLQIFWLQTLLSNYRDNSKLVKHNCSFKVEDHWSKWAQLFPVDYDFRFRMLSKV